MKKISVVLIFTMALALIFSGCSVSILAPEQKEVPAEVYSAEPTSDTSPSDAPVSSFPAAETDAPTQTETESAIGADNNQTGVSITVENDSRRYYASDLCDSYGEDMLLVRFSADLPVVSIPGGEAAAEAINAVLSEDRERLYGDPAERAYTLDTMRSHAAEEYARASADGTLEFSGFPYVLEQTAEVMRADANVISLAYESITAGGGAHGYSALFGKTFSAIDGRALMLSDLSADPGFSDFCADYAIALSQTREYTDRYEYWDDYEQTIRELVRGNSWYLGHEGLVIIANPYDISAYVSGRILFTVPYGELSSYLLPEFTPGEILSSGTFSIREASDADTAAYVIDDDTQGEGMRVLLTANGDIFDISLHRVLCEFPYEDVGDYTEEYVRCGLLWYCDHLQDGQLLEILTWIPDVCPNLEISYRNELGEEICLYPFQSGMDGSLFFL